VSLTLSYSHTLSGVYLHQNMGSSLQKCDSLWVSMVPKKLTVLNSYRLHGPSLSLYFLELCELEQVGWGRVDLISISSHSTSPEVCEWMILIN
jgi:hypothetical protein